VALKPIIGDTLRELGQLELFEPPLSFIYTGLDPASLRTNLMPVINETPYFSPTGTALTPDQRWQGFRSGRALKITTMGFALAEVSAANLSNGFRSFSFAARTSWMRVPDATTPPLNFLDPIVLFQRLVNRELIPAAEATNSWLEVVTKNRVLITVRNEWNSPLTNESVLVTDGTTQHTVPLATDREGTFVAPAGMSAYGVSITGRKLTRIAGAFNQIEPRPEFSTVTPAHHVLSSVRPEDWFHGPEPDFDDPTKVLPLFTENNAVEILVDGLPTFRRMVSDLRKIGGTTHFFLFTNWYIKHTFELVPGVPSSTLKRLLEDINEKGATIRALIWHHFLGTGLPIVGHNKPTHDFINNLINGKSLLDSRTHHAFTPLPFDFVTEALDEDVTGPMGTAAVALESTLGLKPFHPGAHHSKTSVIRATEGTIAYIGGIDFNADRLDDARHARLPAEKRFHDVHSRIAGPAALDLAKAFVDRWNDHPENKLTDRQLTIAPPSACPPGETCIEPVPANPGRATCMVQIARTFGATTQDYARDGDRTICATLKQALGRAKKYIYFEEQYLVSLELRDELLKVLPHIEHLIVVMDHWGDGVLRFTKEQFARARFLFLKPLHDQFKDKLHVFTLVKDGIPYKVHSKVVIIDDVFATIGSANMNRRGFTHDTETNAFILDGQVVGGVRKFARDLRVRLWAEHLGWIPGGDTSKLWHIDKGIDILLNAKAPNVRLQLYDYERGKDIVQSPQWDRVIDPDGSEPPA